MVERRSHTSKGVGSNPIFLKFLLKMFNFLFFDLSFSEIINLIINSTPKYLIVPFILFFIGLLGVILNRKNLLVLFMSIELIILSANLIFVIFAHIQGNLMGHVAVLYVLTAAGAEASIGLAILISWFRVTGSVGLNNETLTRL